MASCWLGACILMSLEKYLDRPWELVLIFGCGGNSLQLAFAKVKNFALSLLRTGFFLSKKHEPLLHRQIESATTETAGLGFETGTGSGTK
jgi:hypothetical protein